VERLAGTERAVIDPARSATVAYDIIDDPDRLVGVPVVREPVPVSVALELACIREGAVRVAHGQRATIALQRLDQRAEERDYSSIVELGSLRQEPVPGPASTKAIIRGLAAMVSESGSGDSWPTTQIRPGWFTK
jgi:hypothetical protein